MGGALNGSERLGPGGAAKFWACRRSCGRESPRGRCATRLHRFGGMPPVARMPRAGTNSGLQPCAGRKKASGAKLRLFPSPAEPEYSTERCSVCVCETIHGWGKVRSTLRGLSGEGVKERAVAVPRCGWAGKSGICGGRASVIRERSAAGCRCCEGDTRRRSEG